MGEWADKQTGEWIDEQVGEQTDEQIEYTVVSARVENELRDRIDEFVQSQTMRPTRSEAIRYLLGVALNSLGAVL